MRTLRVLLITRAGRLARIGGRHILRLSHKPATEALYASIDHRLAAYALHTERFVHGPPRPEILRTAVWINPPPNTIRQNALGATIVTLEDRQHGVRLSPRR